MKKRVISLLVTVAMASTLITGCVSAGGEASDKNTESTTQTDAVENKTQTETTDKGSSADSEAEKTGEVQKVTFTCWYDEDNMEPILAAINEQLGGDYVVEYTYIAQSDYNNVLGTQLAAGEGPDIVADGANFPARIKAGNVKEITGADYLEGINDAGFALCKEGDKIYGIPSYGWFSGVWYNKDIFEQYNVAVPTTFDELVAACDTLAANGVQPMGFGLADGDTGLHSLLGYIENSFYEASEEGKRFDDEFAKGQKTMDGTLNEYVKEWSVLIEKGYINDTMVGISNEQALSDFIAGKTAIFNGGPWQYTNLKDAGLNFGMIPNLGKSSENQYLNGGPAVNFGINVNTKNEEGAVKLMEALASVEVQQAFVDANVGGFSYKEGVTVDIPDEYEAVKGILEKGNVACCWDRWSVNMPSQSLFDEAVSQVQGLATGSVTPDDFVKALDTKADSIRYE